MWVVVVVVVWCVYVVWSDDVVDAVDRRSSANFRRAALGLCGIVAGVEKAIWSAVWLRCLLRAQVRPRKLLVLLEWRRGGRVSGAERGARGRSSVLAEKRGGWEGDDVRSVGGRVCLRDLPRPRALVCDRDRDIGIWGYRLG